MEQEKEIKELKGTTPIDSNMMAFIDDLKAKGTISDQKEAFAFLKISRAGKHMITNSVRNRKFTIENIRLLMEKYNGNANFIFGFDTNMYRP